jgi:[glutamine synthetase] adenylyltransferase / [glutamine synthetase]-adenylyl-L-tyrosine phosphorylase
VALSFGAMEQYFQREGRDWERYAWQKARPVAGDIAAGEGFLRAASVRLPPLPGLRRARRTARDEGAIAAEVARKELADDIKRGPGGIREIEFLTQALQLIRGGREPALRERRCCRRCRRWSRPAMWPATGEALARAYRFLRRLENRLQMLRDEQTHMLPVDALDRARIAHGLGYADWTRCWASSTSTARVSPRVRVAAGAARHAHPVQAPDALAAYWRELPDAGDPAVLAAAGLRRCRRPRCGTCATSPAPRACATCPMPRVRGWTGCCRRCSARRSHPALTSPLRALLALLHNILRRASYLALLDEQPSALRGWSVLVARSGLLAERLAAHPLLLDELLDVPASAGRCRACGLQPRGVRVRAAFDDAEAALLALNEKRQAAELPHRAGPAGRQPAEPQAAARQLAWLADAVVATVLALARREMAACAWRTARRASRYSATAASAARNWASARTWTWCSCTTRPRAPDPTAPPARRRALGARLAQKLVALLGTVTGAGRLYEVDVRLRPDGAKGLLVSSLASYADYQRSRAWTWEHQALVRARGVAGDPALLEAFEQVRGDILGREREPDGLREDVLRMRARMRQELDRSGRDDARFDLKQGGGGLVDLEFLLQYLVLRDAAKVSALLVPRDTAGLLAATCAGGLLPAHACDALLQAHATLLDAGLRCTLDRRSRVVAETPETAQARRAIRAACAEAGLAFA